MKRDPDQCRYCGRRSERIALGLSCFHCGKHPDAFKVKFNILTFIVCITLSAAIGAMIARWWV